MTDGFCTIQDEPVTGQEIILDTKDSFYLGAASYDHLVISAGIRGPGNRQERVAITLNFILVKKARLP